MNKFLNCTIAIIISIFSISVFADDYAIIVDAGSTSSKLHVLQYTESAMPIIHDVFSNKTSPGLAFYADQPEMAANTLKESLDKAIEFLQKNSVNLKTVKISILGTAGMRLIPESKQKAIYDSVTQYIKSNYNALSISDIKTISGQMEGLYGWIDINYLLGNFQNNNPTVGSIDLGGASVQIVFVTRDYSKPNDEISININNQNYNVFSVSFLGLGYNEARNTMEKDNNVAACYPKNYVFNILNGQKGNFNLALCSSIYTSIFEKQQVVQQLPSTQGQSFYAYDNIYATHYFFQADQKLLLNSKVQDVCRESWETLKTENPTIPENNLSQYCSSGIYFLKLIYDTYGLTDSQLTVADQINGTDINWTLGTLLYSLTQPRVPTP